MGPVARSAIIKSIKRASVLVLVLVASDIFVWLLLSRSSPVVLAPEMVESSFKETLDHFERHGFEPGRFLDERTYVVCSALAQDLGPVGIADLTNRLASFQFKTVSGEDAPDGWINASRDVASPGYSSLCGGVEWQFAIIGTVEVTQWQSGLSAAGQSYLAVYLFGKWFRGPMVGGWMA